MKSLTIMLVLSAIIMFLCGALFIQHQNDTTVITIHTPNIHCQKYQDGTISCTVKVEK